MPSRPNTSFVMSKPELAFVNAHFNGSKSAAIHAGLGELMKNTTEEQARQRIENTPELAAHAAIILYEWPNWNEHMAWIATAPVAEIVEWAESVEADEADGF